MLKQAVREVVGGAFLGFGVAALACLWPVVIPVALAYEAIARHVRARHV